MENNATLFAILTLAPAYDTILAMCAEAPAYIKPESHRACYQWISNPTSHKFAVETLAERYLGAE